MSTGQSARATGRFAWLLGVAAAALTVPGTATARAVDGPADTQTSTAAAPSQPPQATDAPDKAPRPAVADSYQTEPTSDIVVTALRREQSLQGAPADISAITGDALRAAGAQSYRDYLIGVPGVSYAQNGGFKDKIFIRGLADSMSSRVLSTTGIYIDEVPITEVDGTLADVGTFDIDRVEVLKGPQGTLYGSSSMGGTVRIITRKPELDRLAAGFDGTLSTVTHGGTNYDANVMASIPIITDRLGVRVVGGYRHDAGFVDNAANGTTDINSLTKKRVRVEVKAKPTDRLEMLLMFQYDDSKQDYGPFEDLAQPRYTTFRLYPEFSDYRSRVYNATLTYDAGFASILATTSYIDKDNHYSRDVTPGDLADLQDISGITLPANTGVGLLYNFPNKLFTQEVRVASSGSGPFRWLVGGYYSNFTPTNGQIERTTSSLTNNLDIYTTRQKTGRKEIAGFGELSYDLTSALELTAGVRFFKYKIRSDQRTSGLFETGDLSGGATTDSLRSSQSSHVAKFRAAYKLSPHNLIFAQASQGFRVGGPIGSFSVTCAADLQALGYGAKGPSSYKSDKLWDYEIGSKNSFAGGKATLNATGYYIDWTDIQLAQNLRCGSQLISNAGRARSRGVEVEGTIAPVAGLSLGASVAYTKSTFRDTIPSVRTVAGGDLPNVPEWTASGSAQYDYRLSDTSAAYLRGDASYVDSRLNDLVGRTSGLVREPAYTIVNARIGLRRDAWDVSLFATNLTDERAILNTTFQGYPNQTIYQPRTVGINLKTNFR